MSTKEKSLHLPQWAIDKAEEIATEMRKTSDTEFSGHLKVLIARALVETYQTTGPAKK